MEQYRCGARMENRSHTKTAKKREALPRLFAGNNRGRRVEAFSWR